MKANIYLAPVVLQEVSIRVEKSFLAALAIHASRNVEELQYADKVGKPVRGIQ